jgi:hypothetical protein
MTVKGLCKSSSVFLLIASLFSCASTRRSTAGLDPASLNVKISLSSDQVVDGSAVLATVTLPPELRSEMVSGEFEGMPLLFFPAPELGEGVHEAVFGVPYAMKPGSPEVIFRIGDEAARKEMRLPLTVNEGSYRSETLSVDPSRVSPPARALKRILREQKEIGHLYRTITRKKYWNGPFVLPIDSSVTSPYGGKRVFNGALQNYHSGMDLKAAVGTPVLAPAGGTVVLSKDLYYTGGTVILDHGYGIYTIYAHLSKIVARLGDTVTTKGLLGLSGATGRVTGPHLHWTVVINKIKVNPMDSLKVMR